MKDINKDFKLYKYLKDFYFEINVYLDNIPKKKRIEKDFLLKYTDDSLKAVHFYVVNKNSSNNVKIKYLKEAVIYISMIDFHLEVLSREGILGKNKYNYFSLKLEEVRKLCYGVIEFEKE